LLALCRYIPLELAIINQGRHGEAAYARSDETHRRRDPNPCFSGSLSVSAWC